MNRGLGPILVALAWSISHAALAQGIADSTSGQRNVGVRERSRPDYEALGGRFGAFLVFPKVNLSVTYDDNIFATPTLEQSDTIFGVHPTVQLVSQWSRHALNFSAGLDHTAYSDHGSENSTAYNIGADGRFDIDRLTQVSGGARYSHVIEARSSTGAALNIRKPVEYDRVDLNLGGSHQFNRVRLNLDSTLSDASFNDAVSILGAPISQKFRDAQDTMVALRVDYTISPDTFVFVRGAYNKHDFDLEPPQVSTSRDSDGYEFTVGADFDLSNLLRGRLEAGYLSQDFASSQNGSFTGFQLRGRVQYFPTQLTTVVFDAERSVQNSSLTTTPGFLSSRAGVQVDHELFRNVILTGRGDYEHATYSGIDRTDDRYAVSVGGTYLLNRNIGVSLTYYYLDQSSKGFDRGVDFRDNRFMATTTLQY
jgi:hypothetical protein